MTNVKTSENVERILDKIDKTLKIQLDKAVDKILANPEVGKPMMYERKGTRELYVGSFRLSYSYDKGSDMLYLLDFYHKDKQ